MDSKGFIRVSRYVLEMDLWRDPYDGLLFFYCLLKASHNRYGSLNPGQLFFSVQSVAKKLQWTRNCVAKHLHALSESGLISINNDKNIITITNWEMVTNDVQCAEKKNSCTGINEMDALERSMGAFERRVDALERSMVALERITPCFPEKHNQKDNQKETPDDTNTSDVDAGVQREQDFFRWWALYPRHDGKSAAKSIWMDELRDIPVDTLIQALENAKSTHDWQKENGRYIPSAAKWLDGRWEDYLPKQRNEVHPTWTEY